MIKNILIIVLLIIGVNLMGMSNQEILEKMFSQNDINEYSKLEYYTKDSFTRSLVNKETPLFRLLDKNLKKIGKEHSIESSIF